MKVKDCYEDGVCPDCSEIIPNSTGEGDQCTNCGHVFWFEYDNFDADNELNNFDDINYHYPY